MTGIVARFLTCDGVDGGEVCDEELMAPDGIKSVHQLKAVAYRDYGWSTRGQDLCPRHAGREQAPHPAPCRAPSSPSCTCDSGEYFTCGAELGRDEFPFTCERRVAHVGPCGTTRDTELTGGAK